jgi:hypothetical protein
MLLRVYFFFCSEIDRDRKKKRGLFPPLSLADFICGTTIGNQCIREVKGKDRKKSNIYIKKRKNKQKNILKGFVRVTQI